MSGLVALGLVTIALLAYAGAALVATLAGASIPTKQQPPRHRPPRDTDPAAPRPQPANPHSSDAPSNDPAACAALYLARTKAGDPAAQYDVGLFYARGDGLIQDYASSASWFHAAAAQGNVAAECNLGVLYEHGLGVPADQTEALNWYRSAADQNHRAAQFNLALAYADGKGTNQDFATRRGGISRRPGWGWCRRWSTLRSITRTGSGVDRSLTDAYAWYGAAGERGDDTAKQRAAELLWQFGAKRKAHAKGSRLRSARRLTLRARPADWRRIRQQRAGLYPPARFGGR